MPGDATFNKEGDGQKLLAPAVQRFESKVGVSLYPF